MRYIDAMNPPPRISLVIPVYCEGTHLRASAAEIKRHVEGATESYEMILVDDGSSDDTWEIVKELADRDPCIHAVRLSRNFGKESAMSAGLERARGAAVIVMDADLQHPPEVIPQMVELWSNSGVDVVDAVKARRGKEPMVRAIGAGMFNTLMNRFSGFDLSGASDYKLLDRKVVDAWLQMRETQLFTRGMIEWLGFTHARVQFDVAERGEGRSAWSIVRLTRYALTALTAFSSFPLHIVTVMGLLFLAGAVLLSAWTLYVWIAGEAVSGFTTVILLQLGTGSIVMLSLGVMGEYVAHVYDEVKRRPRYVVAESIRHPASVTDESPVESVVTRA
jgi:glycosyltransferase involved in cell wall biosynthesis